MIPNMQSVLLKYLSPETKQPIRFKLAPHIRTRCTECNTFFLAVRSNQKYCGKKCNAAVFLRKKQKNAQEIEKRAKKKEAAKKLKQAFFEDPNIIKGYKDLADYLKISVEEVKRRWTDVPQHSQDHIVFFYKEEVDRWAEKVGYWKFKATTVKNYKEPLKVVPEGEGFGYFGAVTTTKDGDGIQCHLCGKFFMHLSGHLVSKHKTNTREYKEQFDLAYTTPLTADNYREKMKITMLEMVAKMTPEEKQKYIDARRSDFKRARQSRGTNGKKITLETKNKRGTCPDQLIDQLRQCAKALGKAPSKGEFISWSKTQRFVHKIYDTFGSFKKAIELAGLSLPPGKRPGPNENREYEDEELLEYLKIFYEQTGKSPTQTDWYSHDLPNYNAYIKKFGSIMKARELAEIPHPLGRWGDRKQKTP